MPGIEEGHRQTGNLGAAADELDELREVFVAQDGELQGAAGDPQRERGKTSSRASMLHPFRGHVPVNRGFLDV